MKIVYAVRTRQDKDGRWLYLPRSAAAHTADAPMLWVKREDAERRLARDFPFPQGTVVAFRLVEVAAETRGERKSDGE